MTTPDRDSESRQHAPTMGCELPAAPGGGAAAAASGGAFIAPSAVLGLTAQQYAGACVAAGTSGARSGALDRYRAVFHDGLLNQRHLPVEVAPLARVVRSESPEGTTVKFTQRVRPRSGDDKALETESVLIPMIGRRREQRFTLCVSSQVGCAMGCTFCQTAQMGLIRSLDAAEIVQQWFGARHMLGSEVGNIVFMGMGEPMDNLDEVLQAITVLTDHRGPALPMSKITISTVGRLDGIRKLAERVHTPGWHRLCLAISLNAPNDEVRSRIMPINRAMPMGALREEMLRWPIYGGFKFCLEYVLIPGVNDAPEHARELAAWVRGLPALINLIPYNPRDGSPWPAPEEARVEEFLGWIAAEGVFAKRRRTKGRDTMAACGQLGNPELRRRARPGTVPVSITTGA